MKRHGINECIGGEFTLCGYSFDVGSTEGEEEIVFAEPGQSVTCADCRQYLDFIREDYGYGYVYKSNRRKGK
jgi:hypothetical protein